MKVKSMKVVRVTKTEFELEDGRVYDHPVELDDIPSLEDFQEVYEDELERRPESYWEIGKPVLEHRLIMEDVLGRPLAKYETVHHLDGNRENNNMDNLQLRLLSDHPPGIETSLTFLSSILYDQRIDIGRLLRENIRLKNEVEKLKRDTKGE